MCVYVFAPKKSIDISYASESIWLKRFSGKMSVVLDILIKNTSDTSINELNTIIPQQLNNNDGWIPEGVVCDLSGDIIKDDPEYANPHTFETKLEDGVPYAITLLPDPKNVADDLEYKGEVYLDNAIAVGPDNEYGRGLLAGHSFGFVSITLGTALKPGNSRWLRIKISPLKGPDDRHAPKNRWIQFLKNAIKYRYDVSGPRVVAEGFKETVELLVAGALKSGTSQIIVGAQSMNTDLVSNGSHHSDTKVLIHDWRTRFYRKPMDEIIQLTVSGQVRVVGTQPNQASGNQNEEYYEWATGPVQSTGTAEEGGYFKLGLIARYRPDIWALAPVFSFLGFILAIVALVLR